MSIEGLAAARHDREARETATRERLERLARRVAWIRRAILFPLLVAALALIWYVGVAYGRLTCLPRHAAEVTSVKHSVTNRT